MKKNILRQIFIKLNGKYKPIYLHDICYCEASGCFSVIQLANGDSIKLTKTLKQIEFIFNNESFIRIHRSYLINRDFIKEILDYKTPVIIFKNGKEITSSQRKKSYLRKIFHFI